MDLSEEFTRPSDHSQIVKGKRTKRQRPSSPFGAVTSSSSSGGGGGGGDYFNLVPSPTTSGDISTEEEEDMANCLILLAQGGNLRQSQKFMEIGSKFKPTTTSKAGIYVYECKTCSRSFPSFQALGGHRASHKKPKATTEEKKKGSAGHGDDYEQFNHLSLEMAPKAGFSHHHHHGIVNKSNKIHECSICGAEFSSGQALGGHMRRHRSVSTNTIPQETNPTVTTDSHDQKQKQRNILSLDLNLAPPPEDDNNHHHHRDSKFQPLVFSATPLVDCHY